MPFRYYIIIGLLIVILVVVRKTYKAVNAEQTTT